VQEIEVPESLAIPKYETEPCLCTTVLFYRKKITSIYDITSTCTFQWFPNSFCLRLSSCEWKVSDPCPPLAQENLLKGKFRNLKEITNKLYKYQRHPIFINPTKHCGYYMYHLLQRPKTLHFVYRMHVSYNSHNKQQ
jgi:hypothetical protein